MVVVAVEAAERTAEMFVGTERTVEFEKVFGLLQEKSELLSLMEASPPLDFAASKLAAEFSSLP